MINKYVIYDTTDISTKSREIKGVYSNTKITLSCSKESQGQNTKKFFPMTTSIGHTEMLC